MLSNVRFDLHIHPLTLVYSKLPKEAHVRTEWAYVGRVTFSQLSLIEIWLSTIHFEMKEYLQVKDLFLQPNGYSVDQNLRHFIT
jgi:hypothetical protein